MKQLHMPTRHLNQAYKQRERIYNNVVETLTKIPLLTLLDFWDSEWFQCLLSWWTDCLRFTVFSINWRLNFVSWSRFLLRFRQVEFIKKCMRNIVFVKPHLSFYFTHSSQHAHALQRVSIVVQFVPWLLIHRNLPFPKNLIHPKTHTHWRMMIM